MGEQERYHAIEIAAARIFREFWSRSRASRLSTDRRFAMDLLKPYFNAPPQPVADEFKICRICGQPVRPSEPQVDTGYGKFQHLHCYQGRDARVALSARQPKPEREAAIRECIADSGGPI